MYEIYYDGVPEAKTYTNYDEACEVAASASLQKADLDVYVQEVRPITKYKNGHMMWVNR